ASPTHRVIEMLRLYTMTAEERQLRGTATSLDERQAKEEQEHADAEVVLLGQDHAGDGEDEGEAVAGPIEDVAKASEHVRPSPSPPRFRFPILPPGPPSFA